MANLKEIRNSIASVSSTKQITMAMKMVSAAKLRKAQDAVIKMRPYATKLQEVLSEVCSNLDSANENPLMKHREIKNVLIIVLTSNRGMCGAFNSNILKQAVLYAQETYPQQYAAGKLHFWCFGKKGGDFYRLKKYQVAGAESSIFDHLTYRNTSQFAEDFMAKYLAHEFDRIDLIYNRFKNAAVQITTIEQFLPVPLNIPKPGKGSKKFYIFEPGEEEIIEQLVPKTLKIQLFKALLDSYASEQGARMTAMHKATDNATVMIRDLKLKYNKARQASITNEILEIVSGANALKE
jgi:F-type H+-transporting ATPase subunit gamma